MTRTEVDLTQEVQGVLPAANGGTGVATPGTSGNVLTSNGSSWTSAAPTGGGVTQSYVDGQNNAFTSVLANNMILDPSFETNSMWANAAGVMDTTTKQDGAQSRKLTANGAGYTSNRLVFTHDVNGNPLGIIAAQDSLYQLEVYIAKGSANHTAGGVRIQVFSYTGMNGTGTATLESNIVIPMASLTTAFQFFQLTAYIASASAQSATFEIGIDPATTSGDTFNVDAIYCVDLSWYDIGMQLQNKAMGSGTSFAPLAPPAYYRGGLFYDTTNECLTFYNNDSNISLQIGQELWQRVYNNTGSTIANGVPVYITGNVSGLPSVTPCVATAWSTVTPVGLTTESIATGTSGWVTAYGDVHGMNTSAYTAGANLYVDVTAGGLTTVPPPSPNFSYRVGVVTVVSSTVGVVHVIPSTASPATTVPMGSLFQPMERTLNAEVSCTVTTTAPSYPSMKNIAYNQTTPVAFTAKSFVGGTFTTYASNGFNLISGGPTTPFVAYTGYELEFWVSGTDVAFYTYSNQAQDFRIFVDEQPCAIDWQSFPSTAGGYFITLNFQGAGPHKVRGLMGGNSLAAIYLPGSSDIWAADPRPCMAIIGDSYVQGPFTTGVGLTTAINAGALPGRLAQKTGWTTYNMGQGGTGYSNPSTTSGMSVFGSTSRMAALAALPALDAVMVFGGANDTNFSTYPEASTLAAAQTMWNAIKAARPQTPLIVAGIQSGPLAGYTQANMTTLNNDLKAQALANPNVTAFIDMRTNPWVTGTGNAASPTGDGNADFFIGQDTIHPSWAGYENLSTRMVAALRKVRI